MPDMTYDAVIVGGGNKALACAMYLQRYGGMSVGIFERRHEAGGGWATEECAAPGFLSNTHAQMIFLFMHYLPLHRDFPEFDVELDMYVINNAGIFNDSGKCLGIYTVKHDPSQERTAKEIARFSQRDADMWLIGWDLREVILKTIIMGINSPAYDAENYMMGQMFNIAEGLTRHGLELEPIYLMYSNLRAQKEFWESKEMQCILVRQALSSGFDVTLPGRGGLPLFYAAMQPYMCFHIGGTHRRPTPATRS